MIFDAEWRRQFQSDVLIRLGVVHPDLTRMAVNLRNNAGVDVWTESPSDTAKLSVGKVHFSLEGWRSHYKVEFSRLSAWDTQNGARLQSYDSQAKSALDGYLISMPVIAAAFNSVIANYLNAGRVIQALVSQPDRDALAAAIEAQLQ